MVELTEEEYRELEEKIKGLSLKAAQQVLLGILQMMWKRPKEIKDGFKEYILDGYELTQIQERR